MEQKLRKPAKPTRHARKGRNSQRLHVQETAKTVLHKPQRKKRLSRGK
jgi:hypothetical protein